MTFNERAFYKFNGRSHERLSFTNGPLLPLELTETIKQEKKKRLHSIKKKRETILL